MESSLQITNLRQDEISDTTQLHESLNSTQFVITIPQKNDVVDEACLFNESCSETVLMTHSTRTGEVHSQHGIMHEKSLVDPMNKSIKTSSIPVTCHRF